MSTAAPPYDGSMAAIRARHDGARHYDLRPNAEKSSLASILIDYMEAAIDRQTLLDSCDQLADALRRVAWNEAGGYCWCRDSPELTGEHQSRCLDIRSLLKEVDREA